MALKVCEPCYCCIDFAIGEDCFFPAESSRMTSVGKSSESASRIVLVGEISSIRERSKLASSSSALCNRSCNFCSSEPPSSLVASASCPCRRVRASFNNLFYRFVSLTYFSKNLESSRSVSTLVFILVVSFFYLISA